MVLKPVRETCVPRPDVLAGGLSDNHFAAQLDKIVRDPANYPVYGDPDQFFALTYPTSGLKTLLSKTFGRLTGAKGVNGENGVLRSETSFGGGKTHGLTAVYHLAKGARPANLDEFVDTGLLPDGPVQVAAIVGDSLDPSSGLETNGVTNRTIWGEMAAQIGPDAVAALAQNEQDRTAPGTETLKKAFGGKPTVVIIDEIAQHLRVAMKADNQAILNYAQQIPVFLKNLSEVAGDPTNRVVLIVTLASTLNAFGAETNEVNALLDEATEATQRTAKEAAEALTRMVQPSAIIKPADDSEIGEILKRRLFETIDPKAAAAAAKEYQALYEELVADGESLSGGAERPATYAKTIERYYPFHPELVRVLDKRLGAIRSFQRARGALKLLAEVVHALYRDGDTNAVINVADLDFDDEPVRNHLTRGLERPEFATVAEVDIAGPTSHAAAVDSKVFPGKPPYASRVGRTVFVHSLELSTSAGAGRAEWLLGTLQPGDPVALLEKALIDSERVCWHLSSDGARWRFHIEPNVNAILEEEKANIANTMVAQVLDDRIRKAFSNDGGATTIIYPTGPAAIPDAPELRIAVIDPNQRTVTGRAADTPDSLLVEMLDTVGQAGTPRKYRNSVVFVVADTDQMDNLKDRIRGLIAADAIAEDATRMAQFGDEVRKKIEAYRQQAALEARIAITRAFRHVYFPVQDKAHSHLRHRELPAQQQGDTKSATSVVIALLTDEAKIKSDKPSFDWLKSKAWPASQPALSTEDLANWFWVDHGSPMVRNIALIREAITDGIRNDGWVYADTASGKAFTGTNMAGLQVEFRPDTLIMTMDEATTRGLLVRKPTVADLKGTVQGSNVVTGAQLRAILEAKCGGEPAKGDVLEALAGALSQHGYDWLLVTDGGPGQDAKALTPTQVKDKGLDGLHIFTRQHGDTLGVEVPGRTVTRSKFTASGPSGVALTAIADKVADANRPIMTLTIQTRADDQVGTSDIDLLVSSLGMLQQYDITVTAELTAEFDGVNGALEFAGTAERKAYQALNMSLSKVIQSATAVAGTIKVAFTFNEPIEQDSAPFGQIATVMKTLNIKDTTIEAEVAK